MNPSTVVSFLIIPPASNSQHLGTQMIQSSTTTKRQRGTPPLQTSEDEGWTDDEQEVHRPYHDVHTTSSTQEESYRDDGDEGLNTHVPP